MASELITEMLRFHIRNQHVRRTKEALATSKLSALNAQLIFTNASQKSPDKAKEIVGDLINELFAEEGDGISTRVGGRDRQGAGGDTGGTVAPASGPTDAAGGP